MKVNVFFDRLGKPLHALYKLRNADGRHWTMCQKLAPCWFTLKPRHAVNIDGLVLECPECQAKLSGLIQQEQERERSIYEPTPAGTPASERFLNQHSPFPPDAIPAPGGGREADPTVRGGTQPGGDTHPGQSVDGGRNGSVASGGGAESSVPSGSEPRPKTGKRARAKG